MMPILTGAEPADDESLPAPGEPQAAASAIVVVAVTAAAASRTRRDRFRGGRIVDTPQGMATSTGGVIVAGRVWCARR
jgi:hypothetical protein